MSKIIDTVFEHLIPETDSVAIFVDNEPGIVTKKCAVKHIIGDGRKLTVLNRKCARLLQSKNAIRMREICKNPEYRARENNRRRLR